MLQSFVGERWFFDSDREVACMPMTIKNTLHGDEPLCPLFYTYSLNFIKSNP